MPQARCSVSRASIRFDDLIATDRKDPEDCWAGSRYTYDSDGSPVPMDVLEDGLFHAKVWWHFITILPCDLLEELRALIKENLIATARCRFMQFTERSGLTLDIRERAIQCLCERQKPSIEKQIDAGEIEGCRTAIRTAIYSSSGDLKAISRARDSVLGDVGRARNIIQDFLALALDIDSAFEAKMAALQYADFLETTYWRILREYIILRRGERCERCNSRFRRGLQIHHRTYSHRGSEWRYMEDLEVLCMNCHQQEHS